MSAKGSRSLVCLEAKLKEGKKLNFWWIKLPVYPHAMELRCESRRCESRPHLGGQHYAAVTFRDILPKDEPRLKVF